MNLCKICTSKTKEGSRMADRDKVVNALGRCESYGYCKDTDCPYYESTNCLELLRKDALILLKEQEPIKPTVSVDTWICSKCGHTLESQELIDDKENPQVLIHEQYQYCPNCGRKVKWNAVGKSPER